MTNSNEMNAILDRILHNKPADGDVEDLRQWLQTAEGQQFTQQLSQPAPQSTASGKFNINIGKITGSEIQIGDRHVNSTDAEMLRNLISSLLKELSVSTSSATLAIAVRKILVLAASPKDQSKLNLEREVKEIDLALRLGSDREQFTLDQRWGATPGELQDVLLTLKPDIVHFCGHGAVEQGLVLQNENQQAQLVSTTALVKLLELVTKHSKPISCIVLNACYSKAQADAMSPFIDYIVGMNKEIGDKAAINFTKGFYRSLSNGLPYNAAFDFGCNAIDLEQIPEHLTPILQGKAIQKK
ncbi:CHAT domain-containing protein [Phormidesmis sp. 146-33]